MDRGRLTVKFDGLIHLQCSDGYLTASGIEGERLFLRSPATSTTADEALPFFSFTHSVYRIVPTPSSLVMSERAARKSGASFNPADSTSNADITYGQSFSLVHAASQLYVSVAHSLPSANDPDCMSVVLVSPEAADSPNCEFIFTSRYKIHSDGDKLCRSDDVLVRLASKPIFLHVSAPRFMESLPVNGADYAVIYQAFRRGGNLSYRKGAHHGNGPPNGQPANPETSMTLGDDMVASSECTDLALEALSREYLDEVNGCEEMGVSFILNRYDIGVDRANQQRTQLHLSRPFVACGVPIAFYHREREAFLTTSVTAPRSLARQASILDDGGDDMDKAKRKAHRRKATKPHNGVQTMNGADGQLHSVTATPSASPAASVQDGPQSGESGGLGNASFASSVSVNTYSTQQRLSHQQHATCINGLLDVGRGLRLPFPTFAAPEGESSSRLDSTLEDASCNCISLWIIEHEEPTSGGPIRLSTANYRIKHCLSGLYLAVCGSAVDELYDTEDVDSDGNYAMESRAPSSHSSNSGDEPPSKEGTHRGNNTRTPTVISQPVAAAVRETALCLVSEPRTPKDIQRTLFTVDPMFSTDCNYLIEQDCLVLKNCLTGMYVSSDHSVEGPNIRLSLQWQPSSADTIVASYVSPAIQKKTFFLRNQCLWLTKYRDHIQALAQDVHREREARRREAEEGNAEAMESERQRAEHVARLPQAAVESRQRHKWDEELMHSKRGAAAAFAEVDPNKVDPSYRCLSPTIRLCQRALCELIEFCSSSTDSDGAEGLLFKEYLPAVENQSMLYNIRLYRLLFDIIMAPFTLLSGDPTGGAAGADEPTVVGTDRCCLLQAVLGNHRISAMHGMWSVTNTFEERARLPVLPPREGLMLMDEAVLPEHAEIHLIARLAFRLLRQMTLGNSSFSNGWCDYVPHFLALDGRMLHVVETMKEMFSDNPSIPISAMQDVSQHFIDASKAIRRGAYLDFLGAACTIQFQGVPERQDFVCRKLLVEHPEALSAFRIDNGSLFVQLCVDEESEVETIEFSNFFRRYKDRKHVRFVENQIGLLAKLCYDGCSDFCRREVAKVFSMEAVRIALKTFVWTGAETVGESSPQDYLRAHLLRLAQQCFIIPSIVDPDRQLRAGTMLFGASSLRPERSNYFSGHPDDDMTSLVKQVTLNLLRTNNHFCQSDVARSVLMRAAVGIWLRFARNRQYCVDEMLIIIPIFLQMLDGAEDVLEQKTDIRRSGSQRSRTSRTTKKSMPVTNEERFRYSVESVLIMKVREMVCMCLLAFLTNAMHTAADEVTVYLYESFNADAAVRRRRQQQRKPWEDGCAEGMFSMGKVHSLLEGGRSRIAGTFHAATGILVGGDDGPSEDSHSQSASHRRSDGYEAISCGGASSESHPRREGEACQSPIAADIHAYLDFLAKKIYGLYFPAKLVPLLLDVTRYQSNGLTVQAMRLMVQLCVVKRCMAQMVLQVHALPSPDIIRSFDRMHDVSVHLRQAISAEREYGPSWDVSIRTALSTLLDTEGEDEETSPTHASSDSRAAPSFNEDDLRAIYSSFALPRSGGVSSPLAPALVPPAASAEFLHSGSSSIDESLLPASPAGATNVVADPVATRPPGRASACWMRTRVATRLLIYQNTIKSRRRAMGLSEASSVPLHLIIRAEMMAHWHLHESLLAMMPKMPKDSDSYFLLMKFFYYFSLSDSNAKSLQAYIEVFINSLLENERCKVLTLNIIAAVLGTMQDINAYLTLELLTSFVQVIDREVITKIPDAAFVELLSDKIFSKTSVDAVVRRRFLLILRAHNTLYMLAHPRNSPTAVEINFTSALVNLVCNVCGSSVSVLALAQGMLPAGSICRIIIQRGADDPIAMMTALPASSLTACSMEEDTSAITDTTGFKLINPYVRALVALYFTSAEDNKDDRRRRQEQWMGDSQWWEIVQMYARLQHEVCALIGKHQHDVVNCGLTIISRYRMFFLTTIPISLSAFFINCFTTQLFDKLHRVIRNTLHDILHSCAEFGVQLMKHVDALEVSIEEIVNQRRLLGVLQYQASLLEVDSLQGVIQQCADCKGVQRMWLAEQQRILQTNLEERRAGEADEDESDDMGAFDVFFSEEAVSRQLQKSHVHKSGGGLLLSSAIANMREINQVKETLRDILQGNTIIPSIHDTPSEVALIVNAYLLRTPHKAALKESITRILTAMRDKLFLPRTIVGLLNLFYNALQSVLDPPPATSITSGLGGGCGGLTETPTKREGGEDGGGEVSPSAYKLQVVFNELGMTRVVVSLCDVENDVISFSAIRLGVAILDGGNKRVQKSLLEYFVTREEGFFHSIRNILRQNMQWVEHINSEHTYSLLKQGLSGTKSRSSANTANIQLVEALTPTIRQTRLSGDRHQVSLSGWARVKGARRIELVTAIFRLLQLFCEGHFSGMQNYIRSQHDNLHSANMVHESMSFVAELTTFITPANLELVNQGYNLLTEVCQGPCHANQEALIGYDMCGTIRHTLERLGGREATISGEEHQQDTLNLLTEEDAHQLRRAVTTSLLAIIEGCRDPNVYEKIMLQLPLPAVSREVAEMQVEQIVREDGGYDEDDDRTAALFNWIVYLRSIEPYAVEDDELVEVAQLRRSLCGLEQRLGSIEISREDGLEKVYFHIPRICDSLTQERKDTLLWSVDRTSRVTKLADFLHKSDEIIFSIEQRHAFNDWMRRWTRFHPSSRPPAGLCRPITRVLRSSMITYNTHIAPWIFCYDTGYYESLSMWIAFIVNTILTLAEGSDFGSQQLMRCEEALVRILCGWQTIVCAVILFIDLKVSFPIHLYVSFKNQIRYTGGKARLDVKMDEVYAGLTTMDRLRSYASWFTLHLRVFLLFVALLSWTVSPYFAAFNLMLCVYKISTLRTFITAITMNGKQLLLTSLLGIIILYLFSIVGFLAFANEYNGDDEPSSSNSNPNCRTLLQCFTFILNNGLRAGGGVGDVMRPWTWDSPDMLPRLAYDMLFYSLVTVVFLNIMFGIIIDTFGQMRDEKREKEADMHGLCFICGLDSDTLEKSCSDFTNHVQKEHNMWMYLYFMHHLRRKDPSEFTGQESYVQTKIQQNSLDFFPDENCLALADAKKSANPDSSDSDEDEAEDGGSGGATTSTLSEGLSGQRDRNLLVGLMREIASIKDTMGSNYRDITQEWMKMRSALQQMELASRSSTTGGSTIAHGAPTGPHSVSAKTAVYAASERSSVTRSQLHGGSTFVVPSSMSREQLEARVMELQRQCEQQQHHQQQHRSDHSNMSKKSAKPLGREDSL